MSLLDSLRPDALHAPLMAVHGREVTYSPAAGDPETITARFNRAAAVEFEGTDGPVQVTRPILDVVLADLSAMPAQGDSLVVTDESETWRVDEVRPNGSGMARLILVV